MTITKSFFDKTLLCAICSVVGFAVINLTQGLGIDIFDLSGGVIGGLSPFVWNWLEKLNNRLSNTEAYLNDKISDFDKRIEQIAINLGDFATEDDLDILRSETYASKALAQQALNNTYLALEQGKTNQTRINNLLSDSGLLRTVELVTRADLKLSILEKRVEALTSCPLE